MVRKITIGLIVGVTALLIGWDVYAVMFGGPGATISEVVRDAAAAHGAVAFAAGFLCGHLFFPLAPA